MAAIRIDVRSAPDLRDVIHRGVQAIAEGKLVVLPTETVYGLAASVNHPQAVESLLKLKHSATGHPVALAVKSFDEACDFIPHPAVIGRRLARRCWPGPVTLVFDVDLSNSLVHRLPAVTQSALLPHRTLAIRVPAHDLFQEVLRLLPGPVVLSSANRWGEPEAVSGEEAYAAFGSHVSLILDEGRSQFGQPSTVIRVMTDRIQIQRVGVVSPPTVKRLASFLVLLVCTGNTCRSPMAEMLCKKLLAEKLGCPLAQLEDRGVLVMSAGIAAMSGMGPAPEAVQVMSDMNLDLSHHASQPLSDHLVRYADLIFTMTQGHRQALVSHWPDVADRAHVLSMQGDDVADPIGGTLELYRRCSDQILALLRQRTDELTTDELHVTIEEPAPGANGSDGG